MRLKNDIHCLSEKYCMKSGKDSAGLKSPPPFRRIYGLRHKAHVEVTGHWKQLSALDDCTNYQMIVFGRSEMPSPTLLQVGVFDCGEWFPFTFHPYSFKERGCESTLRYIFQDKPPRWKKICTSLQGTKILIEKGLIFKLLSLKRDIYWHKTGQKVSASDLWTLLISGCTMLGGEEKKREKKKVHHFSRCEYACIHLQFPLSITCLFPLQFMYAMIFFLYMKICRVTEHQSFTAAKVFAIGCSP